MAFKVATEKPSSLTQKPQSTYSTLLLPVLFYFLYLPLSTKTWKVSLFGTKGLFWFLFFTPPACHLSFLFISFLIFPPMLLPLPLSLFHLISPPIHCTSVEDCWEEKLTVMAKIRGDYTGYRLWLFWMAECGMRCSFFSNGMKLSDVYLREWNRLRWPAPKMGSWMMEPVVVAQNEAEDRFKHDHYGVTAFRLSLKRWVKSLRISDLARWR